MVDGEVVVDLLDPAEPQADADGTGSVAIDGEPAGTPMGRITARRGHMALLPRAAAAGSAPTAPA